MTANEVSATPNPSDDNSGAPVVTSAPVTTDWRIQVATLAHKFFGINRSKEWAELAGAPYKEREILPWTEVHFHTFLSKAGIKGNVREISRLLVAMEQKGLLISGGWDSRMPMLGQIYVSNGGPASQQNGNLWLSEVLGGELIIPAYRSVTVQITGFSAEPDVDEQSGTGLVLDRSHILTNRHVVEQMRRDIAIHAPVATTDQFDGRMEQCRVWVHPEIDIAIIEVQRENPDDTGYHTLAGMTFRDPAWDDETYVFGYPRVPMAAESAITVQRGEVVNPSTPSMPSRDPMFLYSAIARPGNSGGPIVAGDGRVIGLVVEDSTATASAGAPSGDMEPIDELRGRVSDLEARTHASPFYRGIPTSEIVRAIGDSPYPNDLIRIENWK